ncbi:Glutathione transport system permease protein GsiD [subsurface metagenome]
MADSSSGGVTERKRHSRLIGFFVRLVKEKPLGTAGGIITLLLLLTGIFADFLAPYGMNDPCMADKLLAPSATYWLGTDHLGRDLLSRVIFGARISVIVGLSATTISVIILLVIGILSGYIGGKLDLIVQRFVDATLCIPALILLIVLISIIGPGLFNIILVMGVRKGIAHSRIIRSAVIGIKENVYVEAAKAIGCSTPRILIQHILPNILAPTIILFSIQVPQMILAEASLSFLGFGIPPPTPSWGGMLSGRGRDYMFQAPWMAIWPGLALATVVYSVNMFGDAVRDILDPRMRGGIGRYGVRAKKELQLKNKSSSILGGLLCQIKNRLRKKIP